MENKNELEELMSSAYEAELKLSKSAAATWHAASEYCECARKVSNASDKDAESNPNDWTIYTRQADLEYYLEAMQYLSAAKDIAQKTKVVPIGPYKWQWNK